jgi:ABC-type branched-subunit amino acid transport system permease subunit
MSSSPAGVEVHGANVTLMKITVFCISAALFAVGGATIAGVPQSASGTIQGSYNYTVSLVMIAVLTVTGRRPVLSPILAAALYQVIRVYPPFDSQTFIKYQGVIFGVAAVLIAILPATNLKKPRVPVGVEARAPSHQAGIASQARELRARAKV